MRNEGKRRETSALDKDECKVHVGFPGELIGKEKYLARRMVMSHQQIAGG